VGSERALLFVKLTSIIFRFTQRVAAIAQGSEILSQPTAPNNDGDPLTDPARSGRLRQESPRQSSLETGFGVLLNLRERLKRSANRPQWWSDHLRSFFR